MDERQRQYSQRLSLNEIYTPQIIVDGTQQLIGSDVAALSHALAVAASSPKQQIAIEAASRTQNSVHFTVRILPGSKATLVAALAENTTHSEVARGENAGRTLHHVSVVRVLKEFDSKDADGRALSLPVASSFQCRKSNRSASPGRLSRRPQYRPHRCRGGTDNQPLVVRFHIVSADGQPSMQPHEPEP